MSFFESMTLDTYIVSYLGRFNLGKNVKFIDEIHLYNSGTSGLGINMISSGEKIIIDFKQSFSTDKYVKAFCNELSDLKLDYKLSECIPFITPCDSLIKR